MYNIHFSIFILFVTIATKGIFIDYDDYGYVVYTLVPTVRTTSDNVTFGFKTFANEGTLVSFISANGQYWALKLV